MCVYIFWIHSARSFRRHTSHVTRHCDLPKEKRRGHAVTRETTDSPLLKSSHFLYFFPQFSISHKWYFLNESSPAGHSWVILPPLTPLLASSSPSISPFPTVSLSLSGLLTTSLPVFLLASPFHHSYHTIHILNTGHCLVPQEMSSPPLTVLPFGSNCTLFSLDRTLVQSFYFRYSYIYHAFRCVWVELIKCLSGFHFPFHLGLCRELFHDTWVQRASQQYTWYYMY